MIKYKEILRKLQYTVFGFWATVQLYLSFTVQDNNLRWLQLALSFWILLFGFIVYQNQALIEQKSELILRELHLETELHLLKNKMNSQILGVQSRQKIDKADAEFLKKVRLWRTKCGRKECLICDI